MIQRILLRALPAIVIAAGVAGCLTEPADYVDAVLTSEDETVASGSSGTLRIEVTNLGRETVTIDPSTCPPPVHVYPVVTLVNTTGGRIEQPPVPCPLSILTLLGIHSGKSWVIEQTWHAMDETNTPLPPGTYDVQAWVTLDGGDRVFTNRVSVTVEAAP